MTTTGLSPRTRNVPRLTPVAPPPTAAWNKTCEAEGAALSMSMLLYMPAPVLGAVMPTRAISAYWMVAKC